VSQPAEPLVLRSHIDVKRTLSAAAVDVELCGQRPLETDSVDVSIGADSDPTRAAAGRTGVRAIGIVKRERGVDFTALSRPPVS
jgi:hypothetical protein